MKKLLLTFGIAIMTSLTSIAQIGTIDPNFNLGTGFGPDQWTGKCETIIQQPDGKLLVGGQFKTFNGDTTYYIARLNIDGSRDLSFTSPFEENWGATINQVKVLADGKIMVGGVFLQANNSNLPGIVRLNPNGSIDQSFTAPSSITSVLTFDVQSDGKIILGNLIRLNADGTQDNSFNAGTGISGGSGFGSVRINKILVQPDGKILIGGHYGSYNGTTSVLITRLNSDGTIDNTFNANANFAPAMDGFYGQVYSIKLLPNGKIMIGGNYANNNTSTLGVDRLNIDGSLDTTFKITHSFSGVRNYALDVQSDGKILAANVNFGLPSEAFVVERYNIDGSLDTIFPKRFVNNDVKDLIVQADGKITFVGYFNYNPTGIMRLIGDTPMGVTEMSNSLFEMYPNPASNFLNLNIGNENAIVQIINTEGRTVYEGTLTNGNNIIDINNLLPGFYVCMVNINGKLSNKKLIIK